VSGENTDREDTRRTECVRRERIRTKIRARVQITEGTQVPVVVLL
jgi:hypothetical protein